MDGKAARAAPKRRNGSRVAQACSRCKEKKVRCDGKMPSCSLCAKLEFHCEYAAAPRKRGPGKSKKYIQDLEVRLCNMEKSLERAGLSESSTSPNGGRSSNIEQPIQPSSTPIEVTQTTKSLTSTEILPSVGTGSPGPGHSSTAPLWDMPNATGFGAEFLKLIYCRWNHIRSTTRNDKFKQQVFVSLISVEPNRRFVGPIFDDVMAPFPFLQQSSFEAQLEIEDALHRPAWRASVGAVLALATCFRAAITAFREAHRVAWAYFKTAYAVFPELVAFGDNLEAVESMLLMAMFLKRSPDMQTLSMVISAASRLLQICTVRGCASTLMGDSEEYQRHNRMLATIYVFDQDLSLASGLPEITSVNSEAAVNSLWSDAPKTPTMAAYHKRANLATIKAEIRKRLYSNEGTSAEYVIESILHMNASIEQWRIDLQPNTQDIAGSTSLEELETSMLVHILDLELEYYSCLQMIHWPARSFQLDPVSPEIWIARDPPMACPFNRSAEAAMGTLRLFKSLCNLPYSSIWSYLSHFVSAQIILLTNILNRPSDDEVKFQLIAMESFTQSLKIIIKDGIDLEQMLAACEFMVTMARNAISGATLTITPAHCDSMDAKAQTILNLVNEATHPMLVTQNFMCNLKNRDFDTAVALAHELEITWTQEQRYGPFVPESLMPETYAFGFEVAQEDLTHRV